MTTYSGEFVINNVHDVKNYMHLETEERDLIKTYWETQASDVMSVISIRIPFNDQDINFAGVLNIDCTNPFPLGESDEFHATYWSLMLPIMQQITPYIRKYQSMYIADLQIVTSGQKTSIPI